jgi:hypothetical protein
MPTARSERLFILGDVLQAERARWRKTWADLGRATGRSIVHLHLYKRGVFRAPVSVIQKLEEALKLAPGALVAPDQQAARRRAVEIRVQKLEQQKQSLLREKSSSSAA